ncbi:DUF3592 domain-containing protein [Prosthecobacter sp.]|uniref:DUF3592 domain-containing protein n=1 Tax=Prosthecobacter sp. TaxID=1965333 RepID=UPI003782D279
MKKKQPGPRVMLRFQQMLGVFVIMAVLAFISWEVQDFAASFAATEMTTETRLRTTQERDDARVLRAFETARQSVRSQAKLETETNPQQQTRDARLTLTGTTKKDVLAERELMVQAMQNAFAREGPGELFDIGSAPYAQPVPNETMALIKQACRGLALTLLLAGLLTLFTQWKRSRLPVAALLGILATTLTIFLQGHHDAAIALPLVISIVPFLILVLMIYVTRRVKKAEAWIEGRARITQSKVEVEHHRFVGDTTKVRNLPCVAYDFNVGGKVFHGDRISVGIAPADNVDQVLKRYAVGAEVPVFYDPENPTDCVLERKPPVSLGCLWTGAAIVLLVYAVVVASFWNVASISESFDSAFPQMHHPLIVVVAGLLGLFCLAAGIWNRLHPRKAFPWSRTTGIIVSSTVEACKESVTSSNSSMRTFYKPVIEFSYKVEGQEYHNIVGAGSPVTVSISGGQSFAEAEAAKYPEGTAVEVCYDPKNPTQSALNIDTEMMIDGTRSLIVAAILIAVAVYAAMH